MPSKSKKRAMRKRRQQDPMRGEVAGWITPDLENHPVGVPGAHQDWVIDHFNLPYSDPGGRSYIDPYKIAFAHGYVRYRSSGGFFDVEGKKENIAKTENVWKPFAKNKHVYATYADAPGETYLESLNEVTEYLGNENEYGGWITRDKVVHPVAPYAHFAWVGDRYGDSEGYVESYDPAFEDGAIRYILGKNGLELNGYVDAIKTLFNIWWPTAIRKDSVLIEPEPTQNEEPWHDLYQIPEDKQDLLNKWKPEHPTRATVKKMDIGESILNELNEYLGLGEEYGGWIDKNKKVHTVEQYGHIRWVEDTYNESDYDTAFDDGAIRYQLDYKHNELNLQGYQESFENTFFIWWPTALQSNMVIIHNFNGRSGIFKMPSQKEKLQATFRKLKKQEPKKQEPVIAPQGGKWWHEDPGVKVESVQLNELREYLRQDDEYGGWITSDKKVHIVEYEGHTEWVVDNYYKSWDEYDRLAAGWGPGYKRPFNDGAIRYVLESSGLSIQGRKKDIQNLFRIWWPTALNSESVYITVANAEYGYDMPEEKNKLQRDWRPQPKMKESSGFYGQDKRTDRSLGAGYTVSIFKHQVHSLDEDKWDESVEKVKDVKSGMSSQSALRLQRKIIDELESRNVHDNNGWVDYFTRIKEDDVTEAYGGTVGFMFRGGYDSGMRSTAKNTKKRKAMSPFSKVNEKYNTNSTFLKVGKNIVEVILNKVTRRIKRGNKITEVEIPTYRIFVDGVDVGYVDNIDKMFFVKNDKDFDRYDNLEEAISKVMGPSYYDGKGSTDFVDYNPDPYALNV